MIAVDTNALVRLIVRDDEGQFGRARAPIARVISEGHTVFVSDVGLAELVWVLDRAYGFAHETIVQHLRELILSTDVVVRSVEEVSRALDDVAAGDGGFADYLIREAARTAGAEIVYTFDRALVDGVAFIEP